MHKSLGLCNISGSPNQMDRALFYFNSKVFFFPRPSKSMEHEPIQMSCKSCKKDFPIKGIVMHAKYHSKCQHNYTPQEIEDLKTRVKQVSAAKKKVKEAERYSRKKEEKKAQTATYYQNNKAHIAQKYQKIAEERRELANIKQISTGRAFSGFVDKIFLNIINKMKSDHLDFALSMQQAYKKQYENDFLDVVFLMVDRYVPIWYKNYMRKTYDCRKCDIVHGSGIELICAEFGQHLSRN